MSKKSMATAAKPRVRVTHYGGKPDVEENDGIPCEMALDSQQPMSLNEMIATMIRDHVAKERGEDFDDIEEDDDFEPDDDEMLLDMSPYILEELEPPPVEEPEPDEPPAQTSADQADEAPQE